jgi:hypothetical protein
MIEIRGQVRAHDKLIARDDARGQVRAGRQEGQWRLWLDKKVWTEVALSPGVTVLQFGSRRTAG